MMNYRVVFFTRTGNSKRVAEKIAAKLSCGVIEITDNMNWKGIIGYIKAGYYSSKDRYVEIKINGNIDPADEIILVAPYWSKGLAPAARTFLKNIPLSRIHLVVTSLGNTLKNRTGYQSVTDIVKSKKNEDAVIDYLVEKLMK